VVETSSNVDNGRSKTIEEEPQNLVTNPYESSEG
jgi:hypothetical protein